jgi:hypothetical protein
MRDLINTYSICFENPKGGYTLGKLGVDGRIILK